MRPEFLDTSFVTLIKGIEKHRHCHMMNQLNALDYSTTLDHLRLVATAEHIVSIEHALIEIEYAFEYLKTTVPTKYSFEGFFSKKGLCIDLAYNDIVEALLSMRRFEGISTHVPTASIF